MQVTTDVFVLYPETNNFSSNTYLITGKEPLLIDPGLHSKEHLGAFLKSRGYKFSDIKKIIITHAHADHFASGKYFPKATFFISEQDGLYLKTKDDFYTISEVFVNKYYPDNLSFLKNDEYIDIGSSKFKVLITPGHTSGSISLYDKKNGIFISGDVLFEDSCGRFDLISSSKAEIISSLKKIKALDFKILLSGHGLVFNSSEEAQKKNLEQILKLLG